MKILILASNPRNDLELDEEIRDLKDVIDSSRNRQNFDVENALAVRAGDLQELLFKHEPQIVHFCGHGGGETGLVFEGNNGGEQWVQTEALRNLFRLFSNKVSCVLLNACYSEEQADEIVNHIDYVIGMNQAIRDDAAIAFSKGFYRALGYGCSIEEAYEFGCNAIQLEIAGESIDRSANSTPYRKAELVNTATKTIIPASLKPILKKGKQVNLAKKRTGVPQNPLPQAQRAELHNEVVRAVTGLGSSPGASAVALAPSPAPPKTTSSGSTPALPRHQLALGLGGLATVLMAAIGIYHYNQRQPAPINAAALMPQVQISGTPKDPLTAGDSSDIKQYKAARKLFQQATVSANKGDWAVAIATLSQIPSDSQIATEADFQLFLKTASEQLLRQAQKFHNTGDINDALDEAYRIPKNSPIYAQAQASIDNWHGEIQALKDVKAALKKGDLTTARAATQTIKNPGLNQQAQSAIGEAESGVNAEQQRIFSDLNKALATEDLATARKLMSRLDNPELRAKAEDSIKAIEGKNKVVNSPPPAPSPKGGQPPGSDSPTKTEKK
jgi:CHAT domain